jgi:hypothetical protein
MSIALARLVPDGEQLSRRRDVLLSILLKGSINFSLQLSVKEPLCLPKMLLGERYAADEGAIQWLICGAWVIVDRMHVGSRSIGDINGEITEFRGISFELDIASSTTRSRFRISAQVAKAFESRIEDHRDGLIWVCAFSGRTLNPESPATSVLAAGNLDEINCQVQAVSSIMDSLSSTLPDIVLVPAISSHPLILFAGVSKVFLEISFMVHQHSQLTKDHILCWVLA